MISNELRKVGCPMPNEPCGSDTCVDVDELERLRKHINIHFDFLDSIQNDLLVFCGDCPFVGVGGRGCATCIISTVIDELEVALKGRP
jgi:hypothetical protein